LNKNIQPSLTKNNKIAIVKNRKSRIIMKDGLKILEMANQIKQMEKTARVVLITNAPVCGKTKAYLEGRNILVLQNNAL